MTMEQTLQEILERLSVGQQEMKKANAELEAARAVMKADIIAKIEAGHERFLAFLDGLTSYGKGTTTCRTETTSCRGEMDVTKTEATPEEAEAAVERQELLEEGINFDDIGSSQVRYGDRCLVVRRRRGAKKRIQDSVGSRQKLFAARKRVIRRAVPAVRKGHMRKGPGKNTFARGASTGKTLEKRQRNNCECGNGRWDRDFKTQFRLWMRKTSGRNFRTPMQLEEENQIVSSTIELQDVIYWTSWELRPPPKPKKELWIVREPEAMEQRSLE
jgi:hypothetical protein